MNHVLFPMQDNLAVRDAAAMMAPRVNKEEQGMLRIFVQILETANRGENPYRVHVDAASKLNSTRCFECVTHHAPEPTKIGPYSEDSNEWIHWALTDPDWIAWQEAQEEEEKKNYWKLTPHGKEALRALSALVAQFPAEVPA